MIPLKFNPFDWIAGPDLGPFGPIFQSWIGTILAALWALLLIYAVVHLMVSIAGVAKARRQHRVDGEEKVAAIGWPVGAVVGLSLVPLLYAALTSMLA